MNADLETGGSARPWAKWLPWACLALYLLACLFFWAGDEWRPEWDGAVYLLTGQSLAAGEGYTYQGEPFFLRPPGLPWLLSFVVEKDGFDPHRVNLLLMFFAGTAVAAVFAAARSMHGVWTALGVALLVGSSPLFVRLFGLVFAEYPFATFTFLGIALLHVSLKPGAKWWAWSLGGAVCLAIAIHMRTVAVLILPGVVLLSLWHGRGRARLRGLLPLATAVLLSLPWFLYSRAAAADAEVPVEQDLLLDYTTAIFHVDPGDPSSALVAFDAWGERIAKHGGQLLDDLTGATLYVADGGFLPVQILVGLAVVAGLVVALRRRGPSLFEWFGLVYATLLITYFAYDARLVMPLVPLVSLYLLTAIDAGGGWLARRTNRPRLVPILGVAVIVGLASANGVAIAKHRGEAGDLGTTYRTMARWLEEETPPGARILCNQAPIVSLLSNRPAYTFRFVRTPDVLAKYRIDYVLFDTIPPAPLQELVQKRHREHWYIRDESKPPGEKPLATVVRVK